MEKRKEKEFWILETVTNILDNLRIIKYVDKANIQLSKMNGRERGRMDIYKERGNKQFSVQTKIIIPSMMVKFYII